MKLILLLFFVFGSITVCQTTKLTPAGSGTSGDPYQISSIGNLSWLVQNSLEWGNYFIQTADIDAASTANWDDSDDNSDGDLYNDTNDGTNTGNNEGFFPIGRISPFFTGSYDGGGFTISNLTVNRTTQDNGLFGMIWQSGSSVQNLNVTNVSISSTNAYTGGLTGRLSNSGSISNCSSSGLVSGNYYVGGLVGYTSSSTISNSYSTASASATNNYVGDLTGQSSSSTISNCYSKGNVSGSNSNQVGAFIGWATNSSTVEYSYSTGTVTTTSSSYSDRGFVGTDDGSNTYTNNFFDTESSAQSTGTGATPKSSAEMQTNTTFTSAGWSGTIWNIGDGINGGYPYFDWQNTSGTPLPVELTSFTSQIIDNNVLLLWQTATEINNYGFDIQRAAGNLRGQSTQNGNSDLEGYRSIGFVEGNGNSNSPKEYSFSDNTVSYGRYSYRLKQIDIDGQYEYSEEVEVDLGTPDKFVLNQNYPNPFNPETLISYEMPISGKVVLKVYNLLGKEVATLVNEEKEAGSYKVNFSGVNLASGTYFYRILAGGFVQTKKFILLK